MSNLIDIAGEQFGRLFVLDHLGHGRWNCKCECGSVTVVRGPHLRAGSVKSCGCHRRDNGHRIMPPAPWRKVIGASANVYAIWRGMHARCSNPNSSSYRLYGERGIAVCERWGSFELFCLDMGPRPSRAYSVERLNFNGDYAPENCVWAKQKRQARNTRRNRRLTINGETLCVSEWAERRGIAAGLIHSRLSLGWPDDVAVLAPKSRRQSTRALVTYLTAARNEIALLKAQLSQYENCNAAVADKDH